MIAMWASFAPPNLYALYAWFCSSQDHRKETRTFLNNMSCALTKNAEPNASKIARAVIGVGQAVCAMLEWDDLNVEGLDNLATASE